MLIVSKQWLSKNIVLIIFVSQFQKMVANMQPIILKYFAVVDKSGGEVNPKSKRRISFMLLLEDVREMANRFMFVRQN